MPGSARREQSKRITRLALLEAGLAEIVERGLDAPSLDAICARAGYTRGAFYVHFENREDFIVQLMEWVSLRFLDTIVTADSPQDSLPEAIGRFLDAMLRDELPTNKLGVRFPHILEASQRLPQIRDRFERLPLAALLATLALILAKPAGTRVQQLITTTGDPGDLEIIEIRRTTRQGMIAHRVVTQS